MSNEQNNQPVSIKVATVLAFEKKLVPSDGYMYSLKWDERSTSHGNQLSLIEKSVRGTISNRLKKSDISDPAKLNSKVENANLQMVDSCSLNKGDDTLKLSFTLKVLGDVQSPSACNSKEFRDSYVSVIEKYINKYGFTELAKRYALNIANGRFLWRNRVGVSEAEVVVFDSCDNSKITFNCLNYSLQNFEEEILNDENLLLLSNKIAKALSGSERFLTLSITAFARLGDAQEVYPSEELVFDKSSSKNKKSKILYNVKGHAAMHSQKIGNALRTIDTWFPAYKDGGIGPIASEPYGSVTNLGTAYRSPAQKADFFTLFDKYSRGTEIEENEEHYVVSVLIRGGVFGESGKDA